MQIHIAASVGARMRGLIGRERELSSHDVLLIAPCCSIHTFLIKQPIDIAFIGRDGVVRKASERLEPRHFLSCRGAVAVLERFSPCDKDTSTEEAASGVRGEQYDGWFHVGQRLCLAGPQNALGLPEAPGGIDGRAAWATDVLESAAMQAFGAFENEQGVKI